MLIRLLAAAALTAIAPLQNAHAAPPSEPSRTPVTGPLVREAADVVVDGEREQWRLEWAKPPLAACEASDPIWFTCPCSGFAFGEKGELNLVRSRGGQDVERMELTPLFDADLADGGGAAVVSRWKPLPEDEKDPEDPGLAGRLRNRPVRKVMAFADYNHDRQATEFVLQVATLPCGKRIGALIGVAKGAKMLHAFGTAEHPYQLLLLRLDHWKALLKATGPLRRVDWSCEDHGSDTQTELELNVDPKGFHVKEREYECTDDGRRGKLLKTTVR